ncbi:hypothetical protein [Streptomyces yaizuensis]|uniref:MFS transporter n=1 Tax=Streptomyces yaizuensis TaxID=2989713 RepID=A0ABQ5NSX9_9ACTN|nr:hypothetical protein [Streptomyces sp. YSPA8]GLF93479.1 hypothetical protein SYYSPA8_04300 [Streptomyces sp. YSPA8]
MPRPRPCPRTRTRPTAAQLVLGSATVVFSTPALLLLTGATGMPGIALTGCVAMALGLLVALVLPPARPGDADLPDSAGRPVPAGYGAPGARSVSRPGAAGPPGR